MTHYEVVKNGRVHLRIAVLTTREVSALERNGYAVHKVELARWVPREMLEPQ